MGFPKHAKDVDKGHFLGVIYDTYTLGVSRHGRACLIVGGVGCESGTVPNGGGVDSLGKTPDGFFASPEATVAEYGLFVSLGDFLQVVFEDVVLESVDSCHFVRTSF